MSEGWNQIPVPKVRLRNVTRRFGRMLAVDDVSLDVADGELLTLLGPSGCGKTTTLRIIAGLEKQDQGEVYLEDRLVSSPSEGVHLQPEKRGIGMVFQSYAIWPHMTVFENVAYPLRVRRLDRPSIQEKVTRVLATVGLAGLEGRMASQLSGGQQQRVALARAIVFEPTLLLLDEPLSNLDAKLRNRMRYELKELQRSLGITTVYVTHDQAEAMILSDRIVVMHEGRIEQIAQPQEIYERPGSKMVADLVGSAHFFSAHVVGPAADEGLITVRLTSADLSLRCRVPSRPLQKGEQILLCIRPEHIRVCRESSRSDDPWVSLWSGTVDQATYAGSYREYQIRVADQAFFVRAHPSVSLTPGDEVVLELDARYIAILEDRSPGPGASVEAP